MPTAYFDPNESPPPKYTVSFSSSAQSCTFSTQTARLASNGNRPMEIVFVRMYLAGKDASRTATIDMSANRSGTTGSFAVAQAGAAASTGNKTLTTTARYTSTPYTSTVTVTPSGSMYFGNDDRTNGCTIASNTNRQFWGEYGYYEVPATPTLNSVTADQANQRLNVSWSATSDWGGGTVTGKGYLIRVSTSNSVDSDGNFSSTFTTKDVSESTTSTTVDISGNTGATYYVQVYAYNQLSSFSGGPKSVASSPRSAYLGPAAAAPTWSDNAPNTGNVSTSYDGYLTASSSTTLTLSATSSNLSTYGLSGSFSGNTYYISGRPTRSGTASVTLNATDTYNQTTSITQSISISTSITPTWPDTTFNNGTANQTYSSDSISATNAASVTANWSGANPGLTIATSGSTVTLSGTPAANAGGTYYIALVATGYTDNATGFTPTASATASVYINPLPVPTWSDITIDTVAAINQPYSSNVSATNATAYAIFGNPQWLSINSSTGALSGTPTYQDVTYGLSAAQKEFTIEASNDVETISQTFSIDVVHPMKIYKTAFGSFVYPTSQVERFDQSLNDFVPVQWIKRYDEDTDTWYHIDLN